MVKDIKVYSTNSCPYCKMLKDFLDANNIKYENIDVGSDPQKAKEMVSRSHQMGVPVVEINGKIITGFDKEAISRELGI